MKRIAFFLIQLLIASVVLIWTPALSLAAPNPASQSIQTVQSLEDTLFAVHYDQDTLEVRVGRLEETVFGQVQPGSALDTRISKLKSALSPSTLGPLFKTPTQNTASNAKSNNKPVGAPTASNPSKVSYPYPTSAENNPYPNPTAQATEANGSGPVSVKAAPAPGETDYPVVGQMEQKLFKKTYSNEDLTLRLNRLEKEVFKTVQTGTLADRADNLRLVVLGDAGTPATAAGNTNMAYGGSSSGGYTNYPVNIPNQYPDPGSGGYAPQYSQIPPGQPVAQPYGTMGGYPQPPNYGANYGDPYGTPIASASPPIYGNGGYYYGNNTSYNGGGSPNSSYNGYPSPASNASTPDMIAAMAEVEKEVLGHTFPSEPLNTRLDRVESKVFHTTSPELSNEDRIQRVIAVSSAGGAPESSKTKAKHAFQGLLPIILTILPLVLL